MFKLKACGFVAPALLIATVVDPANAQFHWPYDGVAPSSQEVQQPLPESEPRSTASIPKPKESSMVGGPSIAGSWSGELSQEGGQEHYRMDLEIDGKGGQTKYPELKCEGKVIRIGASKSYVFLVEVVTKGSSRTGGRCPDGTMTVATSGNDLSLVWFASIKGDSVIAHGVLSKK
jgi:hypothetical protein